LTTKEQRQIKKEENQLMSSTKGLACVGTALSGDIGRKGGGKERGKEIRRGCAGI